tara:strand:- start:3016 stop:3285 length:270 start_codon:yes stop_codon:yes gene_type:complete
MARFINPAPAYYDANGDPLTGGKLYFFDTDGSTPKATYTDTGLTIANANPVILNASGRSSTDIFLQTGGYVTRLDDADDVVIFTADPLE